MKNTKYTFRSRHLTRPRLSSYILESKAGLKGRYDVTGIIRNMMLVNSGFHTRKNFSVNYLQFWVRALRKFRQPYPRPKKFKEYRF